MAEETKHDIFLKRVQVTVAILAGLATLILGVYNIKKNMLSKNEPAPVYQPPAVQTPATPRTSPIQSALEDSAASWIRKASSKYTQPKDSSSSQTTQN